MDAGAGVPVTVDSSDLAALARKLSAVSADSPKAFKQAISSVARASKTETKRAASAIYNVPQKRVDEGLNVQQTTDSVRIIGKRKPVTLRAYGAKQTKKQGIFVTVFRERGRKRIAGGFSPLKFGGVPFVRSGAKRLPIEALYGPSVADMLKNDNVFTPLQERLVVRARAELERRITRELARRG